MYLYPMWPVPRVFLNRLSVFRCVTCGLFFGTRRFLAAGVTDDGASLGWGGGMGRRDVGPYGVLSGLLPLAPSSDRIFCVAWL